MRRLTRTATVTAIALTSSLGLAACGGEAAPGSGGETTAAKPSETREPTDPVPPEEPPTDGAPDDMVEQAQSDLAERAGVEVADITVLTSVAVTWRDGSIGCAEEGKGYTQALVEGYLIELEADGITYAYHQGALGESGAAPFYCEKPTEDPITEG